MVANNDFDLVRGDSFALLLTFRDLDTTPKDVSSWSFVGQVRADPDSPTVLADFIIDYSNAAIGEILVSLDPEDTAAFSGGFVFYDIQLTTDMGFVRTAPRGRLILTRDVTRV